MNISNPIVKRFLLRTVNIWDPLWILLYRIRTREQGPIPPFKNRDRIGARDIDWFIHSGSTDFDVIEEAVRAFANEPVSELSILDFGAGCGRILRHVVGTPAQLSASDVDPTAIRYLERSYPSIDCIVNASLPPLNSPDDSFDVVYSYSVWTHLPLENQFRWLREMQRLLKPGGLLIMSFLGFHGLKLLREPGKLDEVVWRDITDDQLHRDGVIYREYPVFEEGVELFSGITGSYGISVHDPDYIRREWGAYFEILQIDDCAFHEHQDLIVLRNGQPD